MMIKTEYTNIGEVLYSGELPNGLRINVVPKPGFNSFYAVYGTKYGGAMRRFELDGEAIDTPAGVAHFLEHKMFDLPNGDNALNILSANGADPNAFTSSGITCYYFKCTDGFEENLRMLLHFVSTPYFTEETVQKEQGIIGQEIQMVEDSPGSEIYYGLLSQLYDHHPVKDKVAGSIESIAQITDKTLYDCHKVFYAPSNMVLCVEGDVDPEEIFRIASEELPEEKRSIPHADFGEAETLYPTGKKWEREMAVSAPQFLIGAKLNPKSSVRERLIGTLCMKLLFGESAPFYTRLYTEGLLSRDFDAETDFTADTGTVIIGGESKDPEKVYAELVAEVEKTVSEGFDAEYFSRNEKSAFGARIRGLESFEDVCINLLCGIFDGQNYFDFFEAAEGITKAECEAWVKENLSEDKLAIAIIRPVK